MVSFKSIFRALYRLLSNKTDSYYIYIDNSGFINKGDQLMIESIVEQVRKWKPNAVILLKRRAFYQNVSYCYENKILPLQDSCTWHHKFRMKLAFDVLLNKRLYVTPDKVDLILNARGFFLGDTWNISKKDIENAEDYYKSFCKKGRKIIFLPQAFGPFRQDMSKRLIKLIYNHVDYMYARDRLSYQYLKEALNDVSRIRIAPDFTIMLKPDKIVSSVQLPEKQYVVLIVNCKMIDKTDDNVASSYKNFIIEIIRFLESKGENVVLLNHEGDGDEELMHEINIMLDNRISIFTRMSGVDVKNIIGNSKLTISSRYHGVVSGLVQNVPTLCTSWSHKYEELLREHCCEKNILSVASIEESKKIIEDALIYPLNYSSQKGCNEKIIASVKEMWKDVFNIVN